MKINLSSLEQAPSNIKELLIEELSRHNHDKEGNYKPEIQIKKRYE